MSGGLVTLLLERHGGAGLDSRLERYRQNLLLRLGVTPVVVRELQPVDLHAFHPAEVYLAQRQLQIVHHRRLFGAQALSLLQVVELGRWFLQVLQQVGVRRLRTEEVPLETLIN